VLQYMQGVTYSGIAQNYLSLPPDRVTKSRSAGNDAIPAVLGFVRNTVDTLAIDAGCLVAIQELALEEERGSPVPLAETLQALPLCIRNGCDSLGSLAWYRFGYRQRICAHALEHAFPVPNELSNDADRANWVRLTRREWLSGALPDDGQPILAHVKTTLLETETDQ